jgi:nucleoside-diphosphate-sugar epimerase
MFSRTAGGGCRQISELADPDVLGSLDAVMHLGWSCVPIVSEENPGIEEKEDLPLARAISVAATLCRRPPHLFFFSTAAVYGNTSCSPAKENHACAPLGRYAAAKLKAEKIFLDAPRATVLRISNVFGAGCTQTRPQGIIPVLVEACRSGSVVTVWGDGSATKDYIAVADLHGAVYSLMVHNQTGVFNIASGHVLSVNELVGLVSRAARRPLKVEHVEHYPWDVERACISAQRLRDTTGWKPAADPKSAIEAMVD